MRSFDGLIVAKEPVQFSKEELDFLLENIEHLEADEARELLQIADVLEQREFAQKCRDDLIEFCKAMQADYKVGPHHRRLGDLLMDVESRRKDRVTVSVAPRHGKSQLTSIFFIAWYLGHHPDHKVILSSHTADLAVDFGRKVRNLIDSDEYQAIFPGISLASDSKSAGRWNTNRGGEFFACLGLGTPISTVHGEKRAEDVRVGDKLLNCGKPVTVIEVYSSQHKSKFNIAGAECSEDHPVWTMNRGWVYAKNILPEDVLCVESFNDRLKAIVWRVIYGRYLEHPVIQALVQYQVTMRESKKRKMAQLWRSRDKVVRTLAEFLQFCRGYWPTANAAAHHRENRQKRSVFPA